MVSKYLFISLQLVIIFSVQTENFRNSLNPTSLSANFLQTSSKAETNTNSDQSIVVPLHKISLYSDESYQSAFYESLYYSEEAMSEYFEVLSSDDGSCDCIDKEDCLDAISIDIECFDGVCTLLHVSRTDINLNAKLKLVAIHTTD